MYKDELGQNTFSGQAIAQLQGEEQQANDFSQAISQAQQQLLNFQALEASPPNFMTTTTNTNTIDTKQDKKTTNNRFTKKQKKQKQQKKQK